MTLPNKQVVVGRSLAATVGIAATTTTVVDGIDARQTAVRIYAAQHAAAAGESGRRRAQRVGGHDSNDTVSLDYVSIVIVLV